MKTMTVKTIMNHIKINFFLIQYNLITNNIFTIFDMQGDPFWLQNPSILWQRPSEFISTTDMSENETLNAYTRFFLYLGGFTSVYEAKVTPLLYLSIGPILLILMYHLHQHPDSMNTFLDAKFQAKNYLMQKVSPQTYAEAEAEAKTKRMPTLNNPYMNLGLLDLSAKSGTQEPADPTDPSIEQEVKKFAAEQGIDSPYAQRVFGTLSGQTCPTDPQGEFRMMTYYNPSTGRERNTEGGLPYRPNTERNDLSYQQNQVTENILSQTLGASNYMYDY